MKSIKDNLDKEVKMVEVDLFVLMEVFIQEKC